MELREDAVSAPSPTPATMIVRGVIPISCTATDISEQGATIRVASVFGIRTARKCIDQYFGVESSRLLFSVRSATLVEPQSNILCNLPRNSIWPLVGKPCVSVSRCHLAATLGRSTSLAFDLKWHCTAHFLAKIFNDVGLVLRF